MLLKSYESVFLIPIDLSPQQIDEMIGKIKNLLISKGGEMKVVEKWGRRRLAYPIRANREGFYVFFTFSAPPSLIGELTQLYRVTDQIIRQIVCKEVRRDDGGLTMREVEPTKTETETVQAVRSEKEVSNGQQSAASAA